jgi:hypothetical protein
LEIVRDVDEDRYEVEFPIFPPVVRHRIEAALAAVKGGSDE